MSLQEVKSELWKKVESERDGEEARAALSRRGDQPGSVVLQAYETGKCHRSFRCLLWVCPGSFSPKTLSILFSRSASRL